MIGHSFRIDSKVLNVTLDVIEEDKLIQGIKFDRINGRIVDVVNNEKVHYTIDGEEGIFLSKNEIYINRPRENVASVYRINENDTLARISHLRIKTENQDLFFTGKSSTYYHSILRCIRSINMDFIENVFVNFNGEIFLLTNFIWKEESDLL